MLNRSARTTRSAAEFERELARLRREYVVSGQHRIASLRLLLDDLPVDPGAPGDLDPLREAFHKIAGTSGVCGLSRVSDQARQAERAILALQEERIAPDGPILRMLSAAIDALDEAFAGEEAALRRAG